MATAAAQVDTIAAARTAPKELLTPRQLVVLYLVLAPVPGGRWLQRLVRRHPDQAAALRRISRQWARAGSKHALRF